MAVITANTGSGNWNVNGTWVGGVQPDATSDVVIPATAVVTIPTATTALGRSLTVAASGTLAFASTTAILTLGDATAGAGNVAISIDATATITLTGIGTINLISTSTTQQTIASGGKTLPNVTMNSTGSSYLLSDAFVSSGTVSWTNLGAFSTGNNNMTALVFTSNVSTTRSITLGTSVITATSNGLAWSFGTVTGLTLSAASSTITLTGTNSSFRHGTSGSVVGVYGTVNMNGASIATIDGTTANTFVAVTRNGTAAKTDYLNFGSNYTITTLTINSNSNINRVMVQSTVFQATRTLTCASVVITNTVDFLDIQGAGAATWTVAGTGATALGDCQGNVGITFTTPATQTNTGATGSWSDVTKWTSRVPLPQDDVVINTGSGTITADMPRLGANIDFTGFTGTFAPSLPWSWQGNITLVSGMTFTPSTHTATATGRTTHTITSGGKSFYNLIVNSAVASTYTFADAVTCTDTGLTLGLTVQRGTVTWQGNVTASVFISGSANSKTFNMGSGTWSLTGTSGTLWSVAGTPVVINANTSTIVITSASTSARTFAGGGQTFNTLTYTVDNSPGSLTITGANTFANLNVDSGKILTLPSATTTTIASSGTFNVNGAVNGYVRLPAVAANYISVPDSVPLSITGDIDVRVRFAADDWTPTAAYTIFCKLQAAGNRSWQLLINGTGAVGFPGFSVYADGTTATTATSTLATGFTDGVAYWLRATWRQSDGRVQFFTAPGSVLNPTSGDWTQLGTDRSAVIASIFDSTAIVEVGSNQLGVGSPTLGNFYRAQIRNNILDDGTGIQLDADLTTKAFGANTAMDTSGNTAYMQGTYLRLPGIAGQYASSPDSAPLSITGDLTIDAHVALDDWTPATTNALVAKTGSSITRSYSLFVNPTTGLLNLQTSPDGTTGQSTASTVAPTVIDGDPLWVRVSFDVDDGAGNRVHRYYTSTDGAVWTQLGSTVTTAGATSIFDSTSVLEIGSNFIGLNNMTGKVYNVRIYAADLGSGAGTPVFDADFASTTNQTFLESSSNAAKVTVNGAVTISGTLAQAGDGRVSLVSSTGGSAATLSSTNKVIVDYITVQDSTAAGNTPFYAGSHGVLVSNTTNWQATDAPSGVGLTLLGVG